MLLNRLLNNEKCFFGSRSVSQTPTSPRLTGMAQKRAHEDQLDLAAPTAKKSKIPKVSFEIPDDDFAETVLTQPSEKKTAKSKPKKEKTDEEKAADKKRQTEHKATVRAATKANREAQRRGVATCDKQPHYRNKTIQDKRWPLKPGYANVSVCSGASKWKGLSPMYVGPIWHTEKDVESEEQDQRPVLCSNPQCEQTVDQPTRALALVIKVDEKELFFAFCSRRCQDVCFDTRDPKKWRVSTFLPPAKNLECKWQSDKVWPQDLDEHGQLKPSFFRRRKAMYASTKGIRHANPAKKITKEGNKNKPLFSYLRRKRYEYVPARFVSYCPEYENGVTRANKGQPKPEYKELDEELAIGCNKQIIGYDGYSLHNVDPKVAIREEKRPWGHELVLTCLLNGNRPHVLPVNVEMADMASALLPCTDCHQTATKNEYLVRGEPVCSTCVRQRGIVI